MEMPLTFVVVVGLLETPFHAVAFRGLDFAVTTYSNSSCFRLLPL